MLPQVGQTLFSVEKIVQHTHPKAVLQQLAGEMRADVSSSSGDDNEIL
jgi:hypothetical protein